MIKLVFAIGSSAAALLQRQTHRDEKLRRFFVGLRRRDDRDVHPARLVDFVEVDLRKDELFAQARPGDYVCIQAFVNPTPANEETVLALAARAREATGCVVTHGFGPRYLHSTGQLHKGGPPTGLFLQVVDDTGDELPIPGQPFGFGKLIRAQAAGDFASLQERGRRVARVHLQEV